MTTDKREYKKIFKKYRKLLNNINKRARKSPWEYSFGLYYFMTFIKFMKEYYDNKYNVWQSEEEESLQHIQKSLQETLDAYKAWQGYDWRRNENVELYEALRDKFFKTLSDHIEEW